MNDLKVAMIGLDTSHCIEFPRRLQSPETPEDQRVKGLKVVSCLRFPTPFQTEQGQDDRQAILEGWGVKVTRDFDEAVADCDAIMIEINDPAFHLEYFKKCADLGKPIFLDKPLADNIENGRYIYEQSKAKGLRIFSSSSLRYSSQLLNALKTLPKVKYASLYGPLGGAPAGSSIIWYGVHAFEMLQRVMGTGASSVFARRDNAGVVATVEYADGRHGVVELIDEAYFYGGFIRDDEKGVPFCVDSHAIYSEELERIAAFFHGADAPVSMEETLEIMAMLDAADRSTKTGVAEKL